MKITYANSRPNSRICFRAFVAWLIFLGYGMVMMSVHPEAMGVHGQLGDMFGVANSFMTFFAVLGAVINIRYLSIQIEEQRAIAEEQKVRTFGTFCAKRSRNFCSACGYIWKFLRVRHRRNIGSAVIWIFMKPI